MLGLTIPAYFKCYDTSRNEFGAALQQPQPDRSIDPLTCLSCVTLNKERAWPILELEARVIEWAVKFLCSYLLQVSVIVYSHDQAPVRS